ncbi:PilZ domain-containing protein [Hyphomicrobium sp. 99]|uniref:PilZ domain-containing protein n=1 Tax=Hyphomicrobium sp. 99 TaxID=1163419 RepID=UPI0005F88F76|nr:PilZ domain-containing protein [Hyphomicrobium sp. 99]
MLKALLKIAEPARPSFPRSRISNEPDEGNALFEALVCEFHWAALQIGAIASCMNASLAFDRTWMLRTCSNLVPVEAPVVKVALRAWQDIGISGELAASISKIYFDLSDAKKLAMPLIESAGAFSGPSIPVAKLEQISALWRKLAEDCKIAVGRLEPETRWRFNGVYTGNALVLGKFLQDALAGGFGCVNQFGEVAIPVLPQRRKTPRYVLLQPCKISDKAGVSIAFARDISKNGIGLDCERDLALKERVFVELRNGRKMRGIVAWSHNKKVSVQFDEPLSDDDPLIARS